MGWIRVTKNNIGKLPVFCPPIQIEKFTKNSLKKNYIVAKKRNQSIFVNVKKKHGFKRRLKTEKIFHVLYRTPNIGL